VYPVSGNCHMHYGCTVYCMIYFLSFVFTYFSLYLYPSTCIYVINIQPSNMNHCKVNLAISSHVFLYNYIASGQDKYSIDSTCIFILLYSTCPVKRLDIVHISLFHYLKYLITSLLLLHYQEKLCK
jgi:hypothetical protein